MQLGWANWKKGMLLLEELGEVRWGQEEEEAGHFCLVAVCKAIPQKFSAELD